MMIFKSAKAKVAAVLAGSVFAVSAQASVLPPTFSATMADTQADILTAGGLIIGLAVVAMGVRWVKATFF